MKPLNKHTAKLALALLCVGATACSQRSVDPDSGPPSMEEATETIVRFCEVVVVPCSTVGITQCLDDEFAHYERQDDTCKIDTLEYMECVSEMSCEEAEALLTGRTSQCKEEFDAAAACPH